jgi:hypothetical protein
MTQTQNQLASQQNYIAQLLEQLTVNYQNTKLVQAGRSNKTLTTELPFKRFG